MDFYGLLDQISDLLRSRNRVSYRALKLQFGMDEEYLEAIREELIEVQQVAIDLEGKMLVWTGEDTDSSRTAPVHPATPADRLTTAEQNREPLSYTPQHLAEKILTSRTALEGERKQVTAFFCDLANSTAAAEKIGPENMHTLLNRFFELALEEVHRYEGTINQFLGDGFMALFGAPIAREDHARRGVLAALALQRSLKDHLAELGQSYGIETAFRMGLNSGLVVVGSIGDNLRMDYSAIGDTTNLASRLQQAAEPGMILVSENTRRLVKDDFRLKALEPLQVKGKSEPVAAYDVIGSRPRRSPIISRGEHALSQFVGRKQDLATLQELLAQVEAGQGHVVSIVAEAGGGKSRLLYEFRLRCQKKRVTYIEGRCLSYGSSIPYLPIIDILRNNAGIGQSDSPEIIADKVNFALQEVGMDAKESAPYVLQLFGMKKGTESLARLTPEAVRTKTFEILREMSLKGSQQRPIIFEIEDLHWIDKTSEDYLASLVERLAAAAVLLLVTYRPGYQPPWIGKSYASQIALRSLAPQDGVAIVRSTSKQDRLPSAMEQLILAKAEGNPFFLEELTRAVTMHVGAATDLNVPDTVQGVLMARIDRLPEDPKGLLQTASVLGREFSLRLLKAIWERPETLEAGLIGLRQLEFLYERMGTEGMRYVFKHALTQDVAYDSLLTSRRQTLHAAAGQAIETLYADRLEEVYDRLAYHYARTRRADKAVMYLSHFAEKAARNYAHAESENALQEAILHVAHLPAEDQDRRLLELKQRQAHSLYYLGRFPESVDLLEGEQARLERVQDPALTGPYFFWLGHMYSRLGDPERAVHFARRAVEEGRQCGDKSTMGQAYTVLSLEGYWSGQAEQGIKDGRQAIALLKGMPDQYWLGMAYCFLGFNFILKGEFELALEAEAQTRKIGETISDPRIQTYATFTIGWIRAMVGDCETAIEVCQSSLRSAPDPTSTAYASAFLGYAYLEQGNAIQALPLLDEAVQRFTQFRFPPFEGWYTVLLAEAHRCSGQLDSARELAQRGLEIVRSIPYWFGVGWAQRSLGRIALAAGALSEAEAFLRKAAETFAAMPAPFELGRSRLDLAALARIQNRQEAVGTHLAEAYEHFSALKVPTYVERTEQLAREYGFFLTGKC